MSESDVKDENNGKEEVQLIVFEESGSLHGNFI